MLTGNNYLAWSGLIELLLGAKVKLGFTNGKCVYPSEDSPDYEQWVPVDCMVISWIKILLNRTELRPFYTLL